MDWMVQKMLVKKIHEVNKNRVKILLENDFSFVLYKGEVRLYKIKENEDIPQGSYDEIFNKVLPKRAKLRAMNLLKVRPYTVKGLTDKLTDGGYPESIVNIAIDYVSSYHYLDDYQYCCDYINTYKDRKSKQKLIYDLSQKGVSKDLITKAIETEWSVDGEELEEEQIKRFIIKKNIDLNNLSYEEKMKLLASLARKGFSTQKCIKILEAYGTLDFL